MSPELLDPGVEEHHRTRQSDCYALGMVIYEVLSGRIPFDQDAKFVIPAKVIRGDRPQRPEGVWFMDDVWNVLERCWAPQPGDRPGIEEVLQCLEQVSGSWVPPPWPSVAQSTAGFFTWESSDPVAAGNRDGT